jgi:DNA replication protein DnaC
MYSRNVIKHDTRRKRVPKKHRKIVKYHNKGKYTNHTKHPKHTNHTKHTKKMRTMIEYLKKLGMLGMLGGFDGFCRLGKQISSQNFKFFSYSDLAKYPKQELCCFYIDNKFATPRSSIPLSVDRVVNKKKCDWHSIKDNEQTPREYIFSTWGKNKKPRNEMYDAKYKGFIGDVIGDVVGDVFDNAIHFGTNYADHLVRAMDKCNTMKASKAGNIGIFYPEEYAKLQGWNDWKSIAGMSPDFDMIFQNRNMMLAEDGVSPSKALSSFFCGPTITDCGASISACIYEAIFRCVGEEKFDQMFGHDFANFVITDTLYNPFMKMDGDSERGEQYIGNPLYPLFDRIDMSMSVTDVIGLLMPGDIVHIGGVDTYSRKHFSGAGGGWNLIYVGDGMFTGFWSKGKVMRYSYDDVKKMLIDEFNNAPNTSSEKVYDARVKDGSYGPSVLIYETYRNMQVPHDHEINGLMCGIRINIDTLSHFVRNPPTMSDDMWYNCDNVVMYNDDTCSLQLSESVTTCSLQLSESVTTCSLQLSESVTTCSLQLSESTIVMNEEFSEEQREKTFASYEVETDTQRIIYTNITKFCQGAMQEKAKCRSDRKPIGLAISGVPGIGKSHMTTAAARFLASNGLAVYYASGKGIGEKYQISKGTLNIDTKIMTTLTRNRIDVIVLDDVNTQFGCGNIMYKTVFEYCMKSGAALLISSNHKLRYSSVTDDVFLYNDEKILGFKVIQDLVGESYRNSWTADQVVFGKDSMDDADDSIVNEMIGKMIASDASVGKGIIVESSDIVGSCTKLCDIIKTYCPGTNVFVSTDLINGIRNSHIHSLNSKSTYDFVMIRVQSRKNWSIEQFLRFVDKTHNMSLPIIVVVDNICQFRNGIEKVFHFSEICRKNTLIRLRDRISAMFPGFL